MPHIDESHIFTFLIQLLILMGCARALGDLFKHWKQPSLTAEILVGVFLGPTILGRFLPELQGMLFPHDVIQISMLETVAWIGVLFLLMDTGLEIDFSIAWRQRGSAIIIAFSDIIIPIVIAFAVAMLLPSHYLVDPSQKVLFALFIAAVMTISAMPVAARVLHDLKLLKADLGFLVMSALAVNDIIGWVVFTIILGIFTSKTIAFGPIAFVAFSSIAFAALALTIGRRLSTKTFGLVKQHKLPEPATSLTITVLLGLLFGALTQKLGIHALFGFFIAGVVVGEAKDLTEETRGVISQIVHSLFVPVFFASIGLKIDFFANFDFLLVAIMCIVGIAARYAGAWIGAALSKSVPRINRDLIAIAHTPGGEMQFVIALIALDTGLISQVVFVAIIFSAIFSSVIMGPWMAKSMNRRAAVTPCDFLARDVIANMTAKTRDEAIAELVESISGLTGKISSEVLIKKGIERENDFGTAMGGGLAIPHVRVSGLKNPIITFGRSVEGIEWNAPDGEPVHNMFFMATPSGADDIHIQTLASIARIMSEDKNRAAISSVKNSAQLLDILKSFLICRKRKPA